MKEKLAAAIAKKNNDINTFVWKGRKVVVFGFFVFVVLFFVVCFFFEIRTIYSVGHY